MTADRLRLLAAALGVLAVILVLEWVWPSGPGGGAPQTSPYLPHGAPGGSLQARATVQWADSVLARPLFSVSRRPAHVESRGGTPQAPDQARLSGILIGRFGKRAIFAPDGGGKSVVLGEGESVNESVIRSIEPTRVVLASGAVLTPLFDKNRTPSAIFAPGFPGGVPNFQPPAFTGQLPGAFPVQHSVMPQPAPDDTGDQPDNAAPQGVPVPGLPVPVPVFRGPMMPQRRE